MSSAGLPVSLAAATVASPPADDASALTGVTVPFDHGVWSTHHSGMAELFQFEKGSGQSKSHAWNFFHLVKGLKDGIELDNEELPSNFVRCLQGHLKTENTNESQGG